jgi:hypothetical protein
VRITRSPSAYKKECTYSITAVTRYRGHLAVGIGGGQFGLDGQHNGAGPPSEKPVLGAFGVAMAEIVPTSIKPASNVEAIFFIVFLLI